MKGCARSNRSDSLRASSVHTCPPATRRYAAITAGRVGAYGTPRSFLVSRDASVAKSRDKGEYEWTST
jgi:hypothetical protein